MSIPILTPDRFSDILFRVCAQDTSADPDGWSAGNPLWGHCAVVSVAAQSLFGGTLQRASLKEFPAFAHMGSHYLNRFEDGTERDFTRAQFGAAQPEGLVLEERSRVYVLSNQATAARYDLLTKRIAAAASRGDAALKAELCRRFHS